MTRIRFMIDDTAGEPPVISPDGLLAPLRVDLVDEARTITLTEVEDLVHGGYRSHVWVRVDQLARWLTANWWRLCWEPRPPRPETDWLLAHSLAAISGDVPWPAIEFYGDGEMVTVHLSTEHEPDVAGVRYVNDWQAEVPATAFGDALVSFGQSVRKLTAALGAEDHDLGELLAELADERADAATSLAYRRQALAGIDPGEAADSWLEQVADLATEAGEGAVDELLVWYGADLTDARQGIATVRDSALTVDLAWADGISRPAPQPLDLPWQRGARLAAGVRRDLGIGERVDSATFGELFGTRIPFAPVRDARLGGGYRNGDPRYTHVSWHAAHPTSQRFFLARLAGTALLAPPGDHLLAVTRSYTHLQKAGRSFAQELLCPWEALDAITDEQGLDDDAIDDVADYFDVSPRVVLTTLVNKGKLPRRRLDAALS